jgi:hypothetical protein
MCILQSLCQKATTVKSFKRSVCFFDSKPSVNVAQKDVRNLAAAAEDFHDL